NLGRLSTVEAPNGDTTTYGYDLVGNRITLEDGEENVTTWTYDNLNRVIEEKNALNDSRYFQYDAAGRLFLKEDRRGWKTEYTFDNLHRLVEENWYAGITPSHTITWTYDIASQLKTVADSNATYIYDYD